MSEFRIKISTELDSSKAEAQMAKLKELGEKPIDIKIDLGNLKSQINDISTIFKNAFKLDSSALSDINKIANALKEVNKIRNQSSSSGTNAESKANQRLITEYKDIARTVEKLQKQMSRGMGEDGIQRTSAEINRLKGQLESLYGRMDEASKSNVDLFNTTRANAQMVDMNANLSRIESTANGLQTRLNSISFDHVDSSALERIRNDIEQIQQVARQDINLEIDTGTALNRLNDLSTEIRNLQRLEDLNIRFDRIADSLDTSTVERFRNELQQLGSVATNTGGDFDRAFSNANNTLRDLSTQTRRASTETSSLGRFWSDFSGNFAQFTMANVAGDFITDGIRMGFRALKDVVVETDKAITETIFGVC